MIAVPPDNPAGITSFADLAGPGVQVVVCAPQVPCGAATQQVEANTGVTLAPVSEESSVTDVLNKVTTGRGRRRAWSTSPTSGLPSARCAGIAIPAEVNAVNTYPIAVLAGGPGAGPGRAVRGAGRSERQGQQVLADAGFGAP